jgi:leucyl aminopeptidase
MTKPPLKGMTRTLSETTWRDDFSSLAVTTSSGSKLTSSDAYRWVICAYDISTNEFDKVAGYETMRRSLARREKTVSDLIDQSIVVEDEHSVRICWTFVDTRKSFFSQLTALRKGAVLALEEQPEAIAVQLVASEGTRSLIALASLRVLLINSIHLCKARKRAPLRVLRTIRYSESLSPSDVLREKALANANALVRWLTALPRSALYPESYRLFCEAEAQKMGWRCRVYRFEELQQLGAGAFVAVAQGSEDNEACIVHLQYKPTAAITRKIALVGKGVCMDTGGYNVKSAEDMQHMNEDMSGSAVVLGLITAITQMNLPWQVDAWLAIAENHIGPRAYVPQDVVTTLHGTTVEIVHTDSEGRLLLADALTLARETEPEAQLVDFATLTGAMVRALGNRMSGVFTNSAAMAISAENSAMISGERVAVFPIDSDYDEDLESNVADIKHTNFSVGGGAILAARFLARFVCEHPWIHVDLSSWKHSGGLGAVSTDITGFGVYWGYQFLVDLHE